MYIIRDIFRLRFGHYKEAKALLDEAYSKGLLPDAKSSRILSDFTGDSYRLILKKVMIHYQIMKNLWLKAWIKAIGKNGTLSSKNTSNLHTAKY